MNHKVSLGMSLLAWGRVDCNNNLFKSIILSHFVQKANIGCLVEIIPLNFNCLFIIDSLMACPDLLTVLAL